MKLLEKPKFTTAHSRAGTKRALLGCAGHLLGGFVLSAGAVAGGCSPFAVVLVAVSGRRDFLFSALGAGLGYMIFGTGTARVRYFAAVLIALVGALAMAAFLPRRDARLPMALSCLAVGLTGAVLQLRLGGGAADYALVLGESEIYPKNISVILDKFDRMRVEIACDDPAPGLSSPVLQARISKTCGRSLEAGQVTRYGSESLLTFNEKPLYCLSVGYAQYAAEGRLCGDTVKVARDGRGHQILIISDGMGRGSRAALDGAMGAGLLSRLLSAGFGFDAALKVVNSALLVKSNEESLATLDCACVDLFTGRCAFYKAGAPRSYVLRHGRLTRCELASMPAGILRGITFAKRTAVLGAGDTVVLLSDGITDADAVGLEALLCRFQSQDQQELADTVLAYAKAHTPADRRDDMSVIVARLLPN